MVFTALAAPPLPLILTAGAISSALLVPWLIAWPRWAIVGLFVSLLAGQLIRLPLPSQAGGLLLSDVTTIIVLFAAGLRITTYGLRTPGYWLLVTGPFILYSLWTNLIYWSPNQNENFIALAYWARLTVTLLLLPALLFLFQSKNLRRFAHNTLFLTTLALIVLGLLQRYFLPDLLFLARHGWDPHQGRLVSTWLDPNLFGAFLLITAPYLLFRVTSCLPVRPAGRLLVPALASLALLLTRSRSSLLALLLTSLIFSPLSIHHFIKYYRARGAIALVAIFGLIVVVSLVAIFFLGDRARGLLTVDITARLRLESLQAAMPLAGDHLFTGVGYNRYQFAAKAAGLTKNFSLHSRAGADNSLLTLLITTGLLGLLLFFVPWIVTSHQLIKKQAFPALFSLVVLLIHSQFINSLLYSHLLITLIVVVALSLTDS